MPVYRVKRKAIRVAGGEIFEKGQTVELTEAVARAFADNLETEADQKAAKEITAAEEKAAKEIAAAEKKAAEAAAKAAAKAAEEAAKAQANAGGE